MWEAGKRMPLDPTIFTIVRIFRVNETWLRTGKGDMFLSTTRESEISDFISRTVTGPDNVKKRLIFALSQLSEDEWDVLEKILDKMENAGTE